MTISEEQPTVIGFCKNCGTRLYQNSLGRIVASGLVECLPGEVHEMENYELLDTPEGKEAVAIAAQKLADNIDAEILQSYISETSKNEPSEKRGE